MLTCTLTGLLFVSDSTPLVYSNESVSRTSALVADYSKISSSYCSDGTWLGIGNGLELLNDPCLLSSLILRLVSCLETLRLFYDSSSSISFCTFFLSLMVSCLVIILFLCYAYSIILSVWILFCSIFLNISWLAKTCVAKKSHPSPSCLNISSLRMGLRYCMNSSLSFAVTSILSRAGTFESRFFRVAISM